MRLFLRSLLFTFFAITLNSVTAFSQTATIKTDQLDYPPGSTVIITGTGWQPEETVTLQVLHEGETGDNEISGAHAPFTAIADGSGNISSTWTVPYDEDELGATLLLTAVGSNSGLTASWTFTDANVKFSAAGLPKNTVVPLTVSYTSASGQSISNEDNSFSTGNGNGTASIAAQNNSSLSYSYASTITVSGITYTLVSSSPSSSIPNIGNGVNVAATYAAKQNQTITFNPLANKTYGDAAFPLGATSSSGLTVSYSSSNTNVATVSGNTLTIVGAGSTTITASQAGSDNYNAAT